jgi:hypothetical protein
VDDFFRISRLIELILYGLAAAYLGHQIGKPPEQRHWHKLKRRLKRPTDKSLDVCEGAPHEPDTANNDSDQRDVQ